LYCSHPEFEQDKNFSGLFHGDYQLLFRPEPISKLGECEPPVISTEGRNLLSIKSTLLVESKEDSLGIYPATNTGGGNTGKRRPVFVPYNTGIPNIHVDQSGFQ
jgi:hypothetical protein